MRTALAHDFEQYALPTLSTIDQRGSYSMKTAVVTGANGYLGLAICKRLMDELPETERLRLVVTSRTFRSVIQAVKILQTYALRKHKTRKELIEFDYLLFDQTNMVSVLSAAHEIRKRYDHIDYFFFNSSFSQMGRIDYLQAIKDFFTQPLRAFTIGTFKIQGPARKSSDGMGAAFQANVFAPWYLVQEILPVLKNGGRLIWISTSISLPEYFQRSDLGVENTLFSYEVSKYELELLHQATYNNLLKEHGIQSWLLHPGVFKSTTFAPSLNFFTYFAMLAMFYMCRWAGSPYHCIYPELASNAPLYLALRATPEKDDISIKYGSGTTRGGHELLLKEKFAPPKQDVDALYAYVQNKVVEWKAKLANQIIERVNY